MKTKTPSFQLFQEFFGFQAATTAMTVMPFVLIVQLVMADVIFELNGTAKAVSNITVGKWSMTA